MRGEKQFQRNRDIGDLPVLPDGWCWSELGQLAAWEPNSITDGPFGSNLKTEHYTDSGPRVIRLQNIGDGVFRDVHAHISEDRYNKLQKHRAYSNDLVIAALGQELPRACLIPHWLGPAIVKADCIRLKPETSAAIPKYLTLALNSPGTRKRTATIIHGVGRPRLNLGEIKDIVVPLTPLNEQRRIVEKIDELFSKLDAGVSALERVKAALKRYRAAVLKAAVEGKLTAEWRMHHPAKESGAELLRRILDERRSKWEQEQRAKYAKAGRQPPKGWQAKYKEPMGPETSGLPTLPESWCWATIEQVGDVRLGRQRSPKNRSHKYPTRYIRAANITEQGLDLEDILEMDFKPTEREVYRLKLGDIVLSEASGFPDQAGKPAVSKEEIPNCCFQNTVLRYSSAEYREQLCPHGVPALLLQQSPRSGSFWRRHQPS